MNLLKSLTSKVSILATLVVLSQPSIAEDYRNYGGAYQPFGEANNSGWPTLPSDKKASNPQPTNKVGEMKSTSSTHINNGKRDTIPTKKCDGCTTIQQ